MARRQPTYARIMRGRLKKPTLKEAIHQWSAYGPAYKASKGFRGAYLIVDSKTGEIQSITLWTNQAAMRANARTVLKATLGDFGRYFSRKPKPTHHRIRAAIE
ncbi:MAG: hypothetical protein U1F33_06300 [Alphaproteobacteria bacterium]